MCIPLFLWMWTSICSWHFYEIGCNAYHFCRLFQILKKMYNESVIPLYIVQQNHNSIVRVVFTLHSVVHFFHKPRWTTKSRLCCISGGAKKMRQNHDSIVYCTTKSWFHSTSFFAPPSAVESWFHCALWGRVSLKF